MIIWTRDVVSGPIRKGSLSVPSTSFTIRHLRPIHLLLEPGTSPTPTSFWSKIFIISFDRPLVQARPSDIGWTIRAGLSCAGNTLRRVAAENQGPNRVPRITLHSLCILSSYSLFSLPFDPFWSLLHPAWSEHCEVLRDETHFSLPSHLIPLGEMKPILRYPLFSFTVSR
jgi:hypothetical protein